MPLGISNITNVTLKNITDLANFTEPMDFFVNVNNVIYSGYLYFILFFILWFIMLIVANKVKDQILNNMMYTSAIISVLAFFARALGILTDFQMWVFPVLTSILALIVWMTKE